MRANGPYAECMAENAATSWTRPAIGRAEFRRDVLLAVILCVAAFTTSQLYVRTGMFEETAEPWLWVIALTGATLPLAFRRRAPVPVALIVAVAFFLCGQFLVPEILVTNISMFCALYSVGAWENNRVLAFWTRFGIGIGMIAWLVVVLIMQTADADALPAFSRVGLFSAYATFSLIQIITNVLYFGGAYFFGERAWNAARAGARLEARGAELDLERQTSAEQAVALDRIEIARELHDVVAHHVSVMGIQAAAARRLLERDPARAAESLETVEANAGQAVDELRRLVGTLRSPDRDGEAPTTVGLAQLSTLVTDSQASGTPTTLITAGVARPVPMLVDVALYRVVQEALTNIRKHAGGGASAEVRLRFGAETVEVEVTDDGVRQSAAPRIGGAGLGLRGMRERVGAVGGSVLAERRERGGFLVRATVPVAAAPGHPVTSESSAPAAPTFPTAERLA